MYLRSYKNRVSKHFVIHQKFTCLIASLLCCLLMSFYFTCFAVRGLFRSGCRQNYYLTPPLPLSLYFFVPAHNSLFNTSDSISARLKLVSVPFSCLLLGGPCRPCDSTSEWKRKVQRCFFVNRLSYF